MTKNAEKQGIKTLSPYHQQLSHKVFYISLVKISS
jgi:hypothetical protein